jgi:biotin transporter BioY
MSGLGYLLWYFPIAVLSSVILQACKHDDPRLILRRSAKEFLVLTAAFVVGGIVLLLIHNFL